MSADGGARRVSTGDLMALDAITRMDPEAGATAVRNVPMTWPIFDTHFPRKPVVPGVVLMGCLARLAAALLLERTGRTWVLAAAERVRFRHFVAPGDQAELSVDVKEVGDDVATFKAAVAVDGRAVTTVATLRMVPAAAGGAGGGASPA